MIQVIDSQLNQWDVGRSVSVSSSTATHVHFANQGDSKAVIIEIENGKAKIPDYLLQTGKILMVYVVLDGVTLEFNSFAVRKRPRPESYVYEDDQRNYIYTLITNAENAIASANTAAESASQAAGSAILATENASKASASANEAANSASQAAKTANEAAAKAAHTAKSLMVVGGAEGKNISLTDAIDQFFVGCKLFGRSTQAGTPTPDAPLEIVSLGDSGSITIDVTGNNGAQSVTIATPNGLPGIPVTSGGNYTDANGQQWICDEIDFARGVYVKRLEVISHVVADMNNSEGFPGWKGVGIAKYHPNCNGYIGNFGIVSMCNIASNSNGEVRINTLNRNDILLIPNTSSMTQSEWKAQYPDLVFVVMFNIPTPIETPLSAEELEAYAALHTYRDRTTVSNDAGAYMAMEYVMDAKKYIDKQIASSFVDNATVE